MACNREMYSASVIDSAISPWSFDVHSTGQSTNVFIYPVCDLTLVGCCAVSWDHVPEKSASAKQSKVGVLDGRSM